MAKRALLIGINSYAQPGSDLRGCVNDVHTMHSLLTEVYDFADDDIVALVDGDATQARMQAEIAELVAAGAPGDVLLLHYSGHGSHVRDDGDDEQDGRDEILCPHDLSWDDPFLDDSLRTAFDALAEGVNLTVVMDCCHSGSNTRQVYPPDAEIVPRYLPNPRLADQDDEQTGSRSAPRRRSRRARGAGDVHEVATLTETLITGCRDTQTSADALIEGTFNGALTFHLARAVRELGPQATYRQIHARTLELLDGVYEQVPQLEGRGEHLDRPFLSAPVLVHAD